MNCGKGLSRSYSLNLLNFQNGNVLVLANLRYMFVTQNVRILNKVIMFNLYFPVNKYE